MMKKTTLLLMLVIAAPYAFADDAETNKEMMPPPGPYQASTEQESQSIDNKAQMRPQFQPRQLNNEMPEWVKQQQAQMQQWMRQNSGQSNRQPAQRWNNQVPAWGYNQAPPVQNSYPGQNFQQGSNYYGNRMQQYSPYGRGPSMAPPVFNQQRRQ